MVPLWSKRHNMWYGRAMTDTTLDERRSLGGRVSLIASAILMALYFSWIGQPQDDDPEPSCKPGMAYVVQEVSPDSQYICIPDTILQQNFRVLPPQ